jgi:glycosyltransferase involved in cell wall biosynthesis
MTLLARNEADIVDAQVAFHLNAGVDFVVAIDNGSDDATTEILESYQRDGYLDLTRDGGELNQGEWVTRMARRAATAFEADWVINSDADEFWWPRGGSLKDVFSAVPARFGSVRGMWRHFAPRPDGHDFFAERMTVRVCNPGAENNSPYSPRFKTAHRADPEVVIESGNHHARGRGLLPLRGWYPIDVLHYPMRSLRQCRQKYLRWWEIAPSQFREAAYDADRHGRMREFYDAHVIDEDELAKGVTHGTLAVDTRLRDALRVLRIENSHGPRAFELPPDAERLSFVESPFDAEYLSELGMLEDADTRVMAQRKADDFEVRLARLEQRRAVHLLRAVSQRAQRRAQRSFRR